MKKLDRVINASGKMTILGGSRLQAPVLEGMAQGGGNFYVIHDLMEVCNETIQSMFDVPAAWIVSSASSGIAQSVGAAIAKDNLSAIMNPYLNTFTKREIVIAKGHIVDYGTSIEVPIRMGGGVIVEAGFANGCSIEAFEAAISDNTAALLYVKSHHAVQKGMPNLEDVIALGKKYELPVIVDAAAEGDLSYYVNLGADAVIYSGTKALEGPTSGLVIGKPDFINHLKLQGKGIGRVMKIGKEGIFGLMAALETYKHAQPETIESQLLRMQGFIDQINATNSIKAKPVQDGAGRPIMRIELAFENKDAKKITQALKDGSPKIYTRDYRANEGYIEIDIRDVSTEDLETIYERFIEIIGGTEHE